MTKNIFLGEGPGKDLQGDPQAVADRKLTVRYVKDKAGLGDLFRGPLLSHKLPFPLNGEELSHYG